MRTVVECKDTLGRTTVFFIVEIVGTLLNRNAHIKSYKGFIWCYKSYDFTDGYYDQILKRGPVTFSSKKSVAQIDTKTLEIIKVFPSLSSAAIAVGGCNGNISRAAHSNLQKIAKGYYWQFQQ